MKVRPDQQRLVILFFTIVCLVLSLGLSYMLGFKKLSELAIYLGCTSAVVFVCVAFSLYLSRSIYEHEAKQMIEEVKGVMHMAESRVVIDNRLLKYIEKEASTIWVVTKTLENDVRDPDVSQTVRENLEADKRYCYFTPAPEESAAILRNKRDYEQSYKVWLEKVTFITLPKNTLFMFDEIVIYDPDQKDPFGYTYIDLEGAAIRDQVVRISRENVTALIDSLASFIKPKKEREQRIVRMVFDLREEIVLESSLVSGIFTAIADGRLSIEEQRELEDKFRDSGLNEQGMFRIHELLEKIRAELTSD